MAQTIYVYSGQCCIIVIAVYNDDGDVS